MIDAKELVGTVFSGLSTLVIEDVEDAGDTIVVRARTRSEPVACPGCGEETSHVHGYHERTPADVPVDGRRVVVKMRVRRMRCPALDCQAQTFREQVPGVLERYQRRITRLTGQVSATVRELAGRAGSRLLAALGISVSRHTALRALMAIRLPGLGVPRILGIDDFALRKGLVYATILIDAETGRRVGVLEGRTAAAAVACSNTAGSKASPNMTVADFKIAPQRVHGGSSSPARTLARASVIAVRSPQPVHTTPDIVPCSSITRPSGVPARWCSPSMFWVSTWVSIVLRASRARARWAGLGSAAQAGWASRFCQDRRRSSGSAM